MMWILLLLTLLIIGFISLALFASKKAMKPRQRRKDRTPADIGITYEDVVFQKGDHRYVGWMVSNSSEPLPTVLFVHGWESNSQGMLPHIEYLKDIRWNMFVFDVRGHGDSDATDYMNLIRFSEDLDAAIDYLKGRSDVDSTRLLLFGHSMGAATAITVASRRDDIAGVVASSPFSRLDLMTKDRMRPLPYWPLGAMMMLIWKMKFKIRVSDWDPVRNISKIDVPLFLAFGDRDELFSVDHYHELARIPDIESLLVSEGGHRNLYENNSYRSRIRSFVEKVLTERAARVA